MTAVFSPVIEKNETLPCKRTMYYTTVRNNQITMNFPIYQGENIKASDNLKIGEINLKRLPKAPEGEQVVKVTFIYDINGILDVNIESSVEKVHKVIVNKQIGLSEKELEKRVEQLEKMPLHPWEKRRTVCYLKRRKDCMSRRHQRTVRLFRSACGILRNF